MGRDTWCYNSGWQRSFSIINQKSNYKWYILALAMLSYGAIAGLQRMCLPVLFKEISTELDLNLVSIGTIWGLDPLAGVLIGLPSGLLADRFGVKRSLAAICILAGVIGSLRAFSTNFLTLALSTVVFGFVAATTVSATAKATVTWFSARQLPLANALIQISWFASAMIATMLSATVLSPLLGGWRQTVLLFSGPPILASLLWLTTGREPDQRELPAAALGEIPFKQSLSRVIHIREVWIIGTIQIAVFGTHTGLMGYLPLYLRNIGWNAVGADSAITVLNGACLIGIIPMVLLANRLGSQKGMLIFSIAIASLSMLLLPFVQGSPVYALLIISGFLRSAAMPLLSTVLLNIRGVGGTYGGTAVGLAAALGMVGSFAAPPLGASFTVISQGAPFIFWGILFAIALPLFWFIKGETRKRELAGGRRIRL
jgi:predicted MFS family arabinose efflux permease